MDLYFQGLAWFNKGLTPHSVAQARSFFDRALAADPDSVDALVGSGAAEAIEGANSFVTDPTAACAAACAAAEVKLTKALSSVPDHAPCHMWLGLVEMFTKRAAQGIAECVEISPTPVLLSDLVRYLSVAPKKPRLTLLRRCA
jgi:hypothetical protein